MGIYDDLFKLVGTKVKIGDFEFTVTGANLWGNLELSLFPEITKKFNDHLKKVDKAIDEINEKIFKDNAHIY
jgi:hypothetical protein